MMWWPTIILTSTTFAFLASIGGIDASSIDNNKNSNIDPCDDFYEFTCGRFGKGPNKYGVDITDLLTSANRELDARLKSIIEHTDKAKSAKPFKLVKILYENCMNSDEDELSEDEIYRYYDKLAHFLGWPVVVGQKWRGAIINKKVILSTLLKVNLEPDMENSRNLIPWIKQERRVLEPEILRMGFTNEIVHTYYKFMVDVAVIFGADRKLAENELESVVLTEIMLANDTLPEADRWIHHRTHTRTTVGAFVEKYAKLHTREFVYSHIPQAYNLTDNDVIMVPKDFANVEKVVSQTPKRVLANLIWWLRVASSATSVAEELRDRIREFQISIARSAVPVDKSNQCVEAVRSHLGLSLSALYQRYYIDKEAESDINEMVTFIQQAIYEIVEEADWLDSESRIEASTKVANMIGHVSFRNEYKDDRKLKEYYKDLELVEGDFRQSVANISAFLSNHARSHIRRTLDRDDWTMNGNFLSHSASYKAADNTYSVPAVFTLSEYYDLSRPKSLNYAALGFTIAREMSHSLDSNGIFIDRNSNFREWLSPDIQRRFDERVECMIDRYGDYTVDKVGLKLNAYRNLAENIADNLGVKAAYRAYLKWANQSKSDETLFTSVAYTPKKLFWIGIANTQCRDYKNLELMNAVLADVHGPVKFRINGALADSREFSKDFGCNVGFKMNPAMKCAVW